jgi:hypothetical protein
MFYIVVDKHQLLRNEIKKTEKANMERGPKKEFYSNYKL